MAGERWVQRGVDKLAAFVSANLAAQLRAVETAQSMTVNSLTDPAAVIKYRAPFDNRSPLVQVYDNSFAYLNQRERLMSVACEILVGYVTDADLEAGEIFMRRYMTALLDLIRNNTTLGGTVVEAFVTDGQSEVLRGDNSQTRMLFALGVDVHIHEVS